MSFWNDLPAPARDSGLLDALQGPLTAATVSDWTLVTDAGAPWTAAATGAPWKRRTASASVAGFSGGAIDPATGRLGSGGTTPIEFAGDTITFALWLQLTSGDLAAPEEGAWRLDLDVPGVRVRLPFLRGARLAGTGRLEADPSRPEVRLLVPRLVMRLAQDPPGAVGFEILSATTSGQPLDDVYSMIEMSPPYALIGPGTAVGFAFRTAVLDLSATSGPVGVPPGVRAMPGDWQGFYLPEARLFVAPDGLDGVAVAAGVHNLWIGLGAHAGVTGTFSAEVVNRDGAPVMSGRFITPAGRHIAAEVGVPAQVPDGSVFLADSAGGQAPISMSVSVDGASTTVDRVTLSVPAAGQLRIVARAASASGRTGEAVFLVGQLAPEAGATGAAIPVSLTELTPGAGRVIVVRQDAATATLTLDPPVSATWSWPSGGPTTGTEVTVPVAEGGNVTVTAVRASATQPVLDAYLRFDHPSPSEDGSGTYASVGANIGTTPAPDRDSAPSGRAFLEVARDAKPTFLEVPSTVAPGEPPRTVPVTITGYASCEVDNTSTLAYNQALSERRARAVEKVLRSEGFTIGAVTGQGHVPARDHLDPRGATPVPVPTSPRWWYVRVAGPAPTTPAEVRVRLERPVRPTPIARDPAPVTSGTPDCFRKIGVEVELLRSTVVRCEVWGEFDVQTALEASLDAGGELPLGGKRNPADGICEFRVRLTLATDGGAWQVFGEFRAHEDDLDGLYERRDTDPGVDATVLNIAGAFAVMGPISASVATLSPAAGALVQLGSIALGATGWLRTKVLTIHGGELVVSNGIIAPDGSTTTSASGSGSVSVMLDVEVQFSFDFEIVKVPHDKPVRTRYKAVGIRAGWDTSGPAIPVPIFDPARGYELEIQPGSIQAVAPMDEILRIFGVKVSRDNPTYLEVEAGIGVELGPVTIETIRVRQRLDALEPPQLTKLSASIDIPNAVHGTGSLELSKNGFKASIDITIIPVSIRAAATLALQTKDGVTGLLIGIEVEFPVPILLGGSGLGIFGFLGGVGINYARKERAGAELPALDWVTRQLAPDRKSVMYPDGWEFQAGSYAFAAGLLVGTVEGGYVVHLKGILLIEIPGPRLLLIMKADVLKKMPSATGQESATFLAVLDIDFGRGTITLGVVAGYTIEKILKVHVPVTAFFSTQQPQNWRVDLGTYADRVRVEVLGMLQASGYLMVHGNGLTGGAPGTDVPPLPGASGLSIATGFHLQAVLMGSRQARLYVEVAAGFDAILGFDPFYLAGRIYIRGELMLFIVSIGVSATLELAVGKRIVDNKEVDHPYVHGQVCGKVSFFFFDIEACVSLTIGTPPDPDLVPPPLVAALSFVGRSAVPMEGAGAEGSPDAVIARAAAPGETVPEVPLDAVGVLTFTATPELSAGNVVLDGRPLGSSGAGGIQSWQRLGDRWFAYRIDSIVLTGALQGASKPSAWWNDAAPSQQVGAPALALLTWRPQPFGSAISFGETLTTMVEHRWGTVCTPPTPAAPQLWTFGEQAWGPSPIGWVLPGVVWPDVPGSPRSTSAQRLLRVREPWRSGSPLDESAGTDPARVVGDLVPCARRGGFEPVGPGGPRGPGGLTHKTNSRGTRGGSEGVDLELATAVLANGGELADLQALSHDVLADPELAGQALCPGRVLRFPWREYPTTPTATEEELKRLEAARAEAGWRPDVLADAVVLDLGEPWLSATILLIAPLERKRSVILLQRDAHGNPLEDRVLVHDDIVSATNPLPPTWSDPGGPWERPIRLAGAATGAIVREGRSLGIFLVHLPELQPGATQIAIGWDSAYAPQYESPVHLIAVEGLTLAEAQRYDWDQTVVTQDRELLTTGVTHDPTDVAMLVPGQRYSLAVAWSWDSAEGDQRPSALPTFPQAGTTQTFAFAGQPATKSPDDLRPWLLDSNPGMGDTGIFCHDPVLVTLAHQAVPALFAAYGRTLEVTVLAASGHHPRPPGGGAPGEALVLSADLAVRRLDGVSEPGEPTQILQPWEMALGRVLPGLDCVPVNEVTRIPEVLTLNYRLDPLTDHLLDIHAVTAAGERTRVFRANFTTSRFDSLEHFASWLAPAVVAHRLVRNVAPIDALGPRPTGSQWDKAVQDAGIGVPAVPAEPRVEIWWSSDPVPVPLAVVLESSESLHREHLAPHWFTGPTDATDSTHGWWGTRLTPWLTVASHAGAGDVVPVGPVVIAPGGTRALVRLPAGARGGRVRLDLVRPPDPVAGGTPLTALAVDLVLDKAVWEVE